MAEYKIATVGVITEYYVVEAGSEDEARSLFEKGEVLDAMGPSEVEDVEIVSVRILEPESG